MRSSHTSAHLQKKSTCFSSWTSPHSHLSQAIARTTMPFARLHSQMVCTQSEPAEIPQHMFVQILVQVGGDRKRRTFRTTLRTPTPLVGRVGTWLLSCWLREDMNNQLPSIPSNVWNANRKWTLAWEPVWLSAFSVWTLHYFAVHWTLCHQWSDKGWKPKTFPRNFTPPKFSKRVTNFKNHVIISTLRWIPKLIRNYKNGWKGKAQSQQLRQAPAGWP